MVLLCKLSTFWIRTVYADRRETRVTWINMQQFVFEGLLRQLESAVVLPVHAGLERCSSNKCFQAGAIQQGHNTRSQAERWGVIQKCLSSLSFRGKEGTKLLQFWYFRKYDKGV
jgi:hypothetical protein